MGDCTAVLGKAWSWGFHVNLQVQTALGAIVRAPQARELPCGVFGSFGWSGEAVDELENRLKVHHSCSTRQTGCLFSESLCAQWCDKSMQNTCRLPLLSCH